MGVPSNPASIAGHDIKSRLSLVQKPSATPLFAFISCTAIILIFLIPPSSFVLFPAFTYARETGMYPDGLPLRRKYTGNRLLDFIFTGLAGFFSAAVDGNDEATYRFCSWFLPQLCGILVFCYWEAGRPTTSFLKLPTFVSTMAQLCTAGVTLPVYFASYVRNMPALPVTLPNQPLSRARTVFLAVALGYGAPSLALFAPTKTSIDTRQILAAIWQPFPIYITIIYNLLRKVDASLRRDKSSATEATQALLWIKRSYYSCAIVSAIPHLLIALPSLFTSDPARSFSHVFVPYYLHPYLLPKPLQASIPEYRVTARLLFQHDWLTMTAAALLFFAWSHHMTRTTTPGPWMVRMISLTIVGGPGAAIAWAALEREERIFRSIAAKDV